MRRDFADREDARVGRAKLVVDDDSAAVRDPEPGGTPELVARSNARGDDYEIASIVSPSVSSTPATASSP